MQACLQFRTQDVLQHGEAVWTLYQALLAASRAGMLPAGWRQPKWWTPDCARGLCAAQPAEALMANYLRYHDCGKPACRTEDAHGRVHYPDHAAVSAALWRDLGGHPAEVWLMGRDMLLHCGSAADCEPLVGHRMAPALIFAALSEVHANAEMFGGIDTASFKAKAKHLERRSAQLLKGWPGVGSQAT